MHSLGRFANFPFKSYCKIFAESYVAGTIIHGLYSYARTCFVGPENNKTRRRKVCCYVGRVWMPRMNIHVCVLVLPGVYPMEINQATLRQLIVLWKKLADQTTIVSRHGYL